MISVDNKQLKHLDSFLTFLALFSSMMGFQSSLGQAKLNIIFQINNIACGLSSSEVLYVVNTVQQPYMQFYSSIALHVVLQSYCPTCSPIVLQPYMQFYSPIVIHVVLQSYSPTCSPIVQQPYMQSYSPTCSSTVLQPYMQS